MRKVTTTISNGVETVTVTTRRSGVYAGGKYYTWDTCATVNGREYRIHQDNSLYGQSWLAEHANWTNWLAGIIKGAVRHTVRSN